MLDIVEYVCKIETQVCLTKSQEADVFKQGKIPRMNWNFRLSPGLLDSCM